MYTGEYTGLCTTIFWHIWKETWHDTLYTRKINSMPTLIQTNTESKWDRSVVVVPFLSSPSFQQLVNQVLCELDVISLYLKGHDRFFFFIINFLVFWIQVHFCHHLHLCYCPVTCWMKKYTFYFQLVSC